MPDIYLDELRLELETRCGVSVSHQTVWRNLRKGGYTLKKVNVFQLLPHLMLTPFINPS